MERRSFFERYRPTNLTADPLPLKVLNHSIWKAEMLGHALDWASQYLHQKNCPSYLISPLLGKVLKEMSKADLSECFAKTVGGRSMDEVDADIVENIKYQPLRLMQSVTSKVDDICLRYKEENDQIETDFPNQSLEDGLAPQVYGASYHTIKNTRRTLEDRMVILPEIEKIFNFKTRASYFAVFDGHNGVEAAAYSAAHLHQHLVSSPDFPSDLPAAINYAFEVTDTALLMKCKDEHIRSGTTVVIALIVPGNIYVAWAGDSQAVLVQNSQPVSLVSPHKPDREDEMRRIKGVGGEVISVSGTWRVNGNLAVSRAIGNLDYKEYVTSTPEISHIEVNGSEEFLILACDGLWDVVSPQHSVDILRNSILSDDPSDIDSVSQKLVIEAKQSGSGDNITVIVVLLKPKEELRKLYKAIKMNGSAEAPVEVVPVPVEAPSAPVEVVPVPVEVLPVEVATPPVSPTKALPKNPAPSSKTSLPSSPVKSSSATKPGSATTTRNNLGMRSPSAQKAPVKIGERRATSATTKAPLPPVKTTISATKTTVQKDGVGVTAKPSTQRPATATTRAPVAPRTATAATTKKPLKPEETDKPATTRTVVPPRPRPGTAPLSSRLTTSKAPVKQDAAKAGEEAGAVKESATATKRSVLNSARPTASKEGGVTSRVTQPRPATSTAPKPRVPSATARPASASVATSKPGSTAAPKPGVTRAAAPTKPTVASTTSSRPPLKKPVGPSVTTATKKDSKLNGQTSLAPKSSDKKIIKREGGGAAGITSKVNGIGKVVDVSKVINGVQAEVEEKIVVADKVKDVDALISEEKGQLEDGVEKVSNGIEKQDEVDIAKEAYQVDNVDVTNENDLSEKEKEDHGKVINGDIAYEDFMVTKPYAVDTAENVTLDQVKHDDNIKSALNESEQVEKSVAQLSESETVSTLELQSETENVPADSPVAESAACEVHDEVQDDLIEQASSVPVVGDISSEIEGVVPEVKASVDEESISTNAEESSDPPEEQITDKDSGLDEDLISDRAQDNECLKEVEENVSSVEASEKLQSVAPDHEIMEGNDQFIADDAQPDPESLVIHDIQGEVNTVSQEDQHPPEDPEVHSVDPVVEEPVISAFPDTDVDVHTQRSEEPDAPDDAEAVIELSSYNPFADSGPEAEGKGNVSGSEAFEDSKGEDEQEKDSVPHAVDSEEEQDKLAEASAQYEHEIAVFPGSKESDEIEPFASDNKNQCVDLEFNIDDREKPSVEDRELVRSEIHTENFTFDSGADGNTENENMQVLDTSGIRNDDFMEDEKQNAIDPTSELQLEPERIEENLVSNEVCSLEQDLIHSGLEERSEEIVKEESTTAEVTEDLFLANTDIVTDALPLEPGSLDLGYKNMELDADPFASQFESHSAPLLDTNVSAGVPDLGDPFTISPDELQLQQGLDQFLIGGDLLGADQKFGNFEFSQGGVNEPENLDFVSEENTNKEQPRHDQDFDCLGFSKIEQQPHETTVLLQNNPFLIDTPIMSKANSNLEQINKNEIDVGFGFGNDNGIGSQLLSSSGGCVDTLLDINSSTCPGSDSEIMYHQTPSDGGNHTGNLVDSVGNEDNDALAILNR